VTDDRPIATTLATADVRGLRFPSGSIEVDRVDALLGSVKVNLDASGARDMRIRVRHTFDPSQNLAHLRLRVRTLIDNLLNELAFATDIPCGPATDLRDDLDDIAKPPPDRTTTIAASPDGTVVVHAADAIRASVRPGRGSLTRVLIVGPEREGELAASLGGIEPPRLAKGIYASVLRATDPIARFILLYGLLQVLVGGENLSQESVDGWIMKKRPDIEQSRSRRGWETTYRRLRNEIAHGLDPERDVDIARMRQEVQREIKGFQGLVKEAIVEPTGP
jgi:hypothetical protein